MAFLTQKDFFRISYPNDDLALRREPLQPSTHLKAYASCLDTRAWSFQKHARARFVSDEVHRIDDDVSVFFFGCVELGGILINAESLCFSWTLMEPEAMMVSRTEVREEEDMWVWFYLLIGVYSIQELWFPLQNLKNSASDGNQSARQGKVSNTL